MIQEIRIRICMLFSKLRLHIIVFAYMLAVLIIVIVNAAGEDPVKMSIVASIPSFLLGCVAADAYVVVSDSNGNKDENSETV